MGNGTNTQQPLCAFRDTAFEKYENETIERQIKLLFDNILVIGVGVPYLRVSWSKCCLNQYIARKLKFVYLSVDFMA